MLHQKAEPLQSARRQRMNNINENAADALYDAATAQ